ncbi:MAG: SusD/RagB family nutrient-binding outer membrane lipoprotein, partial [Bacteroidaceae bacterium]|nr:SusD/RagB family nutrient-binding outer membrane lipoprotein [Bacteroidaceae bacterium]
EKDPLGGGKLDYTRKSTITVAWSNEATNEQKLERIITQKWIACYPLGLEAWAEYRRTGYPDLAPAIDNLSNGAVDTNRGMRRLRFPYTEKDLNTANYNAAVQMIGGIDNEGVDLFWTKKK